jgi:hypothetical protein
MRDSLFMIQVTADIIISPFRNYGFFLMQRGGEGRKTLEDEWE